jgi:hypothetical protein
MSTLSSINGILCADIDSVDGNAKINILKFDDVLFCSDVTPTPTPTPVTPKPTPTPTPTPVPCDPGCCERELCYGRDCLAACDCNEFGTFYLHLPCNTDPCELAYADGIFKDERCETPADAAYYSQGGVCYYWDGSTTLSVQGPC